MFCFVRLPLVDGGKNVCGRYHRILDISTFRSMLQEGLIQADDFVDIISADMEQTLMPSLVTEANITHFFEEYDTWQARASSRSL